MSKPSRALTAAAVSAVVLIAAYSTARESRAPARGLLLAVVPGEVESLARREGYPAEDLWERLRTIGVAGVLLEPQSLAGLLRRAEALHIPPAEAEKWRMAGLVSPGSPLTANSLWVRDGELAGRLARAARASGVAASSQAIAGLFSVALPPDRELADLPLGFAASGLALAQRRRLTPVLASPEPLDLELGGEDAGRGAVFLLDAQRPSGEAARRWLAASSGGWAALPDRSRRPGWWAAWDAVPPRALAAGHASVGRATGPAWRAIHGRGASALICHLDGSLGVEGNLAALRELARELREAGRAPGGAQAAAGEPPPRRGRAGAAAGLALALSLAALGPLAAIRWALDTVRRARCAGRWPRASPVREVAQGLGAAAVAGAVSGLAARALLDGPEWRLGIPGVRWELWANLLPFALGGWALYGADARRLARALGRPVTWGGLLRLLAAAGAVATVLAPRATLGALGLGGVAAAFDRATEGLWWLPWRWRQVLLGCPALVIALCLHFERLDLFARGEDERKAGDYRPWLLLGLLGPAGDIEALGACRAPALALMGRSAAGWAAGAALGALAAIALSWGRARVSRKA